MTTTIKPFRIAVSDEANEDDTQHWIEFALVARDLAGDQPLDSIPIARLIAETSVDAFAAQGARM